MPETMDIGPDGTVTLAEPVSLPEILDVLVVGAGPAGTAAAFRSKELGLAALTIEHDDVLKRIRDYDKAKMIKPDFGAGKQMRFPLGGELVRRLHFAEMPGAEMCRAWRALYVEHSVPVQVGVELLGLAETDGGLWEARAYNHHTKAEQRHRARHIVLALGGGMPRRLDIPGNVRAIRDRLGDAQQFVGKPACVLGGGTSAAEAVIAISRAKVEAADHSPVFWSHRGNRMPTVSEALANELFRATKVHGNVRYLPSSEARAVVDADSCNILRIETDRRVMEDRPTETTQLEFDAQFCVACIGQEIDWTLLRDIGIFAVTGGPRGRKGLPLNTLLESRRPNVYMVGDTLNAVYLECDDFDGDASQFREVRHRGNIKASLIDGVTVIEAIAQRLAGKTEVRVELAFAEPESPAASSAPPTQAAAPPAVPPAPEPTPAPVQPPRATPAAATPPAPEPSKAPVLVRLLESEVEAEEFTLDPAGVTTLGREGCSISFKDDSLMSDRHASIVCAADGCFLRDERSSGGVYLVIDAGRSRAVPPGAILRLGTQWLAFGPENDRGTFTHYDAEGREVAQYRLDHETTILGRDPESAYRPADSSRVRYVTLAQDDKTLSRRHGSVTVADNGLVYRDLQSTNGAELKVDGSIKLEPGDTIRLGSQLLRFAPVEDAGLQARTIVVATAAAPEPARVEAKTAGADATEAMEVEFRHVGRTCPFRPGQSICEIAEANGVKVSADCHSGICGSDPIRVIEGQANLNPMGEGERSTLEDICCVEPEGHRLACVSRPTGRVVVEFVQG